MQELLKHLRRAVNDFSMISPEDRICIGISGGKDSMALAYALSLYKKYVCPSLELFAVTVDLGFSDFDLTPIASFFDKIQVPYKVISTQISSIVFDRPQKQNSCALCSNLRKGAFFEEAQKLNCNKAAFAHHRDDVVETFLMNILYNSKLDVFLPVTFFPDRNISLIRPFIYVGETAIKNAISRNNIPVVKNPCPQDGTSSRQEIKHLLDSLHPAYPHLKDHILTAIKNSNSYHLWDLTKNHIK